MSGTNPFRRKPKELEPQNIDLGVIGESEFLSGGTKKLLVAIAALAVLAVVVVLGVVLSKNGDSSKDETPVLNGPTSSTSPVASPTAAAAASESPTRAPNSAAVEEFMRGLPPYSLELAENDPDSPQAKALAWLNGDPQYNEYESYRLYQRYALAVFYHSTSGASWKNKAGWMSNSSECTWFTSWDISPVCEASHVVVLGFDGNGLDGSIPTELELLSDLNFIQLYGDDNTLSVAIYPELYVLVPLLFSTPKYCFQFSSHLCC
jgi:hypothetical protein